MKFYPKKAEITNEEKGTLQIRTKKGLVMEGVSPVFPPGFYSSLEGLQGEALVVFDEGRLDKGFFVAVETQDRPRLVGSWSVLHAGKKGAHIAVSQQRKLQCVCDSFSLKVNGSNGLKIAKDGKLDFRVGNGVKIIEEILNILQSLESMTVDTPQGPGKINGASFAIIKTKINKITGCLA